MADSQELYPIPDIIEPPPNKYEEVPEHPPSSTTARGVSSPRMYSLSSTDTDGFINNNLNPIQGDGRLASYQAQVQPQQQFTNDKLEMDYILENPPFSEMQTQIHSPQPRLYRQRQAPQPQNIKSTPCIPSTAPQSRSPPIRIPPIRKTVSFAPQLPSINEAVGDEYRMHRNLPPPHNQTHPNSHFQNPYLGHHTRAQQPSPHSPASRNEYQTHIPQKRKSPHLSPSPLSSPYPSYGANHLPPPTSSSKRPKYQAYSHPHHTQQRTPPQNYLAVPHPTKRIQELQGHPHPNLPSPPGPLPSKRKRKPKASGPIVHDPAPVGGVFEVNGREYKVDVPSFGRNGGLYLGNGGGENDKNGKGKNGDDEEEGKGTKKKAGRKKTTKPIDPEKENVIVLDLDSQGHIVSRSLKDAGDAAMNGNANAATSAKLSSANDTDDRTVSTNDTHHLAENPDSTARTSSDPAQPRNSGPSDLFEDPTSTESNAIPTQCVIVNLSTPNPNPNPESSDATSDYFLALLSNPSPTTNTNTTTIPFNPSLLFTQQPYGPYPQTYHLGNQTLTQLTHLTTEIRQRFPGIEVRIMGEDACKDKDKVGNDKDSDEEEEGN